MLGPATPRKPQATIESGEAWIARYDRVQLEAADREVWCGVQIIELKAGSCVDWFLIYGYIVKFYDVAVVSGFATPMVISPGSPQLASLITWDKAGASPAYLRSRKPCAGQEHRAVGQRGRIMSALPHLHRPRVTGRPVSAAFNPQRPVETRNDWLQRFTDACVGSCLQLLSSSLNVKHFQAH